MGSWKGFGNSIGNTVARNNHELWLAFLTMVVVTTFYGAVIFFTGSVPAASNFFGHSLGIFGFTLMVMTETLYSIRKRSRSARFGKMSTWLKFHIYTGLVGPFLVLLHSSWKFNGLAGAVMLLTLIIVFSGFVGRYIYTAIPRTADGTEIDAANIQLQITKVETQLKSWMASQPTDTRTFGLRLVSIPDQPQSGTNAILSRAFADLSFRIRLITETRHLAPKQKAVVLQLEDLIKQRRLLRRQMSGIASARKLLSIWHTVHVPIGIALFTTAIFHITAAIYYATFLH